MKKILILVITIFSLLIIGCGKTPTLTFEKNTIDLKLGELYELKPQVTDAKNTKVNYVSLNESVVKIIDSKLFALSNGETVVVASLEENSEVYVNLNINVVDTTPEEIIINGPTELFVGEEGNYTVDTNFSGAIVNWTTSNNYVATINEKGELETFMPGEVKINVTVLDGSYKQSEITLIIKEKTLETIKVAINADYKDILNQTNAYLMDKGYKLEITEIYDFEQSNNDLNDEFIDANLFQHQMYLDNFNYNNGTKLNSILDVLFIPYGFYANSLETKLENISSGDKIALPNDTKLQARGLLLLSKLGLIDIIYDRGLSTNLEDVDTKGLEIVLVDETYSNVSDCKLIFADYNQANTLNYTNLVSAEDDECLAEDEYAICLVVKLGFEESEKIKVLAEALSQNSVKEYINNNYSNIYTACK